MKQRTSLSPEAEGLKEAFYRAGMEILKPCNLMIADTYAADKRERISSTFDKSVVDEYDKAIKRARNILYEQRNLVAEKWLPRYEILRSKHNGDDWQELATILVDGCLDRLGEQIIALSPLLVDPKYVSGLQSATLRVMENEKTRLYEFLTGFYVRRKQGVPKVQEELDLE